MYKRTMRNTHLPKTYKTIGQNQISMQEFQRGKKNIQQKNADFDYNTTSKRKKTSKDNRDREDTQEIGIPDEPLPTDITSQDDMATIEYINSAAETKDLVHIGIYHATQKDLQCLLDCSKYLNDFVINAYVRILKAQPSVQTKQDGDAYLETTYNTTMICGDTIPKLREQYEQSFRLIRTLTYLNHDMVFFPINIKNSHWFLVAVNGRKGVIQVLDSTGSASHPPQVQQLIQGLHNRIKRLKDLKMNTQTKWQDVNLKEWRAVPCINKRMQTDGSSCGLFVLKFMELWTGSRLSSIFTQVPCNVQISCTSQCPILHYKFTTISIGNAQKDITNFRLKLAVTLVDYPWNKVKESPGYKSMDVEKAYKLEDNEK
ncbi:hypothetical protein C2845_PM01G01470 [Panicum miliaceum]|uniref:Ubiquitin-like protease family profile domain-containing protein n=1 Tax=Panicum miliaceum TaxID=4540 RepID=A0A3L6TM85_PANMI|nr:hypothetical protein C2845_PM01G01470 [Panicum miliaceum]